MTSLNGQVALVTGGGRGLGKEICFKLSELGCVIVVADIKQEETDKVVKYLQNYNGKAYGVRLDVSDEESVEDVFKYIEKEFGKLDILINNAAIDVTLSLDDISFDDWQKVLKVNLFGPFFTSKLAFSLMQKNGKGQIVNICSTASKRAWGEASAYHASKWGLLGFSHAIHTEGRKKNIKVTAVVSGGMKTPFILERFPGAEGNLQDPKNVAEAVKFVLTLPEETVIPEIMVLPMKETSWP